MTESPLLTPVLFSVGPVPVTLPVVTTWGLMAFLVIGSALATRRLALRPGAGQSLVELVVTTIEQQLDETMQTSSRPYLPLLGTLFLYLVVANLSGIVPGMKAPTAALETAAALALITFLSVQVWGVLRRGPGGYLASFAKPTVLMLPLNLLAEVTRAFSLMVRLFGNVMSGEFVIAMILALAGLFVPVPLMALEILLGLIQAYIFTILAAVFIGGAVGSIEKG
ncbi:F0F1 ATP synthase subunit A [Rhodocista pekingensis]|uniref:ATP synthase subunit a n=1 Tax=Rhodocista pekingensis TaxID=201185 RepID=A0ABW2KUW9_9PROT